MNEKLNIKEKLATTCLLLLEIFWLYKENTTRYEDTAGLIYLIMGFLLVVCGIALFIILKKKNKVLALILAVLTLLSCFPWFRVIILKDFLNVNAFFAIVIFLVVMGTPVWLIFRRWWKS
jgi:presenilin-like A22 family membrane protease